MSQDSYWTMTALGVLFDVDMMTVRRCLQKYGLINSSGMPTGKAEKGGYVRRFWRNKEEYCWTWHKDKSAAVLKKMGLKAKESNLKSGSKSLFGSLRQAFSKKEDPKVQLFKPMGDEVNAELGGAHAPDVDTTPLPDGVEPTLEDVENEYGKDGIPPQLECYGELTPVTGGPPIPLLGRLLLVGRRRSCDIVLPYSNVSGHHCELLVEDGYWYVKDLHSTNGTTVNQKKIRPALKVRLNSGDLLSVAGRSMKIQYSPAELRAMTPPALDETVRLFVDGSILDELNIQ